MLSSERELKVYRFLAGLRSKLNDARDVEQAARSALRDAAGFFEAAGGCLASVPDGETEAQLDFVLEEAGFQWDTGLLGSFFRNERPEIGHSILLAPLRRRERIWRVLGLHQDDRRPFVPDDVPMLNLIGTTVSELIQRIDRDRIAEVRSRIQRKIMEELRPKDLFYQILHGLRSLTSYDHSAALLVAGEQGDLLELVAEQISWRKAKSQKIGLRLPVAPDVRRILDEGEVLGFDREADGWAEWDDRKVAQLAELFDYNDPPRDTAVDLRERTMLCAPIVSRDGLLGVLKIAARFPSSMGPYEVRLVERFMPPVSVAIRNSQRTESLQQNLREAERKNAMADLARGVAHDLNNALGGILPLVQQMRRDAERERIDPQVMTEDLQQVERSIQVCRRIFGGMLNFARGATEDSVGGDLLTALRNALTMLDQGMKRRGIVCEIEIPDELPSVRAGQTDLEQVFFNLLANARDAMPKGGTLRVQADAGLREVLLAVEDTGIGIPAEDLPRVQEPFFSTKRGGTGLGLSIVRSIVWGIGGNLSVSSREGEGTRVELRLPKREED
jgi:signal transduction histidine kinase